MRSTSAAIFMLLCAQAVHGLTIDMVTVGNPGNAPDTRYDATGFGSVAYTYRIGKYEITARQYTEFLNAVAKDDPNGLYHVPNPSCGICMHVERIGSSPNFSYSVAQDWADRPMGSVNFWNAARFANWLHNGQPIGPQGPGTTEDGAYHDVGNQALFGRNAGGRFFIPTEDEWYKAAYHNGVSGLAASYFDYPTRTNIVPGKDISEATNPGNNANFAFVDFAIGHPYYRTLVGEFELSHSPYGTFDQGGNLVEWNESIVAGSTRGLRGASFYGPRSDMLASYRHSFDPATPAVSIGFRVVAIPEPSTFVLAALGTIIARATRCRIASNRT